MFGMHQNYFHTQVSTGGKAEGVFLAPCPGMGPGGPQDGRVGMSPCQRRGPGPPWHSVRGMLSHLDLEGLWWRAALRKREGPAKQCPQLGHGICLGSFLFTTAKYIFQNSVSIYLPTSDMKRVSSPRGLLQEESIARRIYCHSSRITKTFLPSISTWNAQLSRKKISSVPVRLSKEELEKMFKIKGRRKQRPAHLWDGSV